MVFSLMQIAMLYNYIAIVFVVVQSVFICIKQHRSFYFSNSLFKFKQFVLLILNFVAPSFSLIFFCSAGAARAGGCKQQAGYPRACEQCECSTFEILSNKAKSK